MENSTLATVPADTLILICLFAGSLARLADGITRTPIGAVKVLFLGFVVGAALTGLISKYVGNWPLLDYWWVAILSTFFASSVVSIADKKTEQLRDMSLKETASFIIAEVWERVKSILPESTKKP